MGESTRNVSEVQRGRRAISVPQRIRNGHHRATLVELDNTAELVFSKSVQVTKLPKSISQAENAGSIPVTRSL
jgi:predicted 2-oxoglutarate/Fe(II)-dependent dioxygenase YbiX